MNARPQFLPPGTSRSRKTLAWLAVLAAGAALGFAILFISAFAVNKIFPPSEPPPPHHNPKLHRPAPPHSPGKGL